MIDLKQKCNDKPISPPSQAEKDYYPSAYISSAEGLDGVSLDQEVTLKGVVKSVTKTERDGKKSFSMEIELRGMETGGKAKSEAKKSSQSDDEEAVEKLLDETMKKKD